MVFVTDAVVDECTVVVEALNTLATSHTVHTRTRPQTPTKKAKIVKISPFFDSFV